MDDLYLKQLTAVELTDIKSTWDLMPANCVKVS